jgi:hypothetical protein
LLRPYARSKDDLAGEHIRQHRRTMRLAQGGVVTLAMLLIAALVAAFIAFQQRAAAQSERDTAIFNQITAQADRFLSIDVSLAAQLDRVAYRMRPQNLDLATALITLGDTALSTRRLATPTPAGRWRSVLTGTSWPAAAAIRWYGCGM